ncbi:MAG: cytochrome c oxidase assembly protein [Actinomycetota bacterium]|nr:cytochrome c oxidase assembly protein [Actinomycetota bacterium]
MLIPVLAHAGQPPAPHDLWTAWNLDPLLIGGFLLAVWAYRRGQTRGRRSPVDNWRTRCFTGALVALGVALLSPLEALSRALASAHMVQHMLLVLVAAPLLALGASSSTLVRGSPLALRRASGRWRRRLRLTPSNTRALRHPGTLWLLHVGTLWFWHAAVPYGAALEHDLVHVLEHGSFLLTGVLFWRLVTGTRGAARVSPGFGVLLVFAMALQSVFLSLLLTFARSAWYTGYAATTRPWHLEPLADQQLAGVIMWIPAGLVHLAAALTLLVAWIRGTERPDPAP